MRLDRPYDTAFLTSIWSLDLTRFECIANGPVGLRFIRVSQIPPSSALYLALWVRRLIQSLIGEALVLMTVITLSASSTLAFNAVILQSVNV